MTDPRFQECGVPLLGEAMTAISEDRMTVPPAPLARYVEDAARVFAGIDTVMGLIESSALSEEMARDGGETLPPLSHYHRDSLVGLVRVSARYMLTEAERLSDWADLRATLSGGSPVGAPAQEAQP